MKMTNKFHYIYILLLTLIYLSWSGAEVQPSLRLMTPIVNTRYYVLCDLHVSSMEDDTSYFFHPVQIRDSHMHCKVYDWRYCNTPPPVQKNGVCGCSSKKSSRNGGWDFTFYLLMDPVTEEYLGSQLTCEIFTSKDTRQIELVMFTRKPDATLYACRNSSVRFDWEFKSIRETISNRFIVSRIEWRATSPGGSKVRFLGTYSKEDPKNPVFSNDGNLRSKLSTESAVLPQLILSNIHLSDTKQTIRINVTFNLIEKNTGIRPRRDAELTTDANVNNATDAEVDKSTPIFHVTTTDDRDTDVTRGPDIFNITDVTSEIATVSTTTTTTTTTPTTTPVSTTPSSIEMNLNAPAKSMIDSVYFIVTEPPSPDTHLNIKAYESITGNLVVTCSITGVYTGYPPVNITIWQDDRKLITRTGVANLHYSTQTEGKTISCGLEGHSLDCLAEVDHRRQKVVFELKDLEKANKPDTSIDLLLSMYTWESIICLVMVFWAVSLLLDHVQFVIRRERVELIEANQEILAAEQFRLEKMSTVVDLTYPDSKS